MTTMMTQCPSKICFVCNTDKGLNEFYSHKQMADGRLNKCKECTKQQSIENRKLKAQYYKDYEKLRSKTPRRKEQQRDIHLAWCYKFPERRKAQSILYNAVKNGKIKKDKYCNRCNAEGRLEAHHFDYSKPLDIRWLWGKCHYIEDCERRINESS